MIDRDAIRRQIEQVEKWENRVSAACGGALAAVYFLWQLVVNHWLATYTWMIPFAVGYAAPRLWFAARVSRLDRMLRGPEVAELPPARVESLPRRPAVVPVTSAAPERVEATADDAGPSVLT